MYKKIIATNIQWDTDGEELSLPTNVVMLVDKDLNNDELLDVVSDKLSDEVGFCHFGFDVLVEKEVTYKTEVWSNYSVAHYNDESKDEPFYVHDIDVNRQLVSLGLREYPDTEQDSYISINDVTFYTNTDDFIKAVKVIAKKM